MKFHRERRGLGGYRESYFEPFVYTAHFFIYAFAMFHPGNGSNMVAEPWSGAAVNDAANNTRFALAHLQSHICGWGNM